MLRNASDARFRSRFTTPEVLQVSFDACLPVYPSVCPAASRAAHFDFNHEWLSELFSALVRSYLSLAPPLLPLATSRKCDESSESVIYLSVPAPRRVFPVGSLQRAIYLFTKKLN